METEAEIREELTDLLAARKAILTGAQSYTTALGQTKVAPPLKVVNEMIKDARFRLELVTGATTGAPVFNQGVRYRG